MNFSGVSIHTSVLFLINMLMNSTLIQWWYVNIHKASCRPASPTDAAVPAPAAPGQESTSIQRTQTCPEAPGPSTGDHSSPSPSPGGPPALQEASPEPPAMEAGAASSEAWQQVEGKVPLLLGPLSPPITAPPFWPHFGYFGCPSHRGELAEPETPNILLALHVGGPRQGLPPAQPVELDAWMGSGRSFPLLAGGLLWSALCRQLGV